MGVPITLLDRYSPEQFEILGNGDDMDMLRELGVRQLGREFIDGYRAEGGTGHYSPGMRMLGLTVPKHRVAYSSAQLASASTFKVISRSTWMGHQGSSET